MIFFEKIVCYSQFQGGGAGRAMQCHMKKHQGWLGGRRNKEKARAGRLIVVFHGKKWLRQGKQAKQVWDWLVWISSASSGIYNLSWAIWFLALGWLKAKNYCLEFKSPVKLTQSCPALCDPMNCSLSGFSVHGIFQSRILEWVAIPFSGAQWEPSKDGSWGRERGLWVGLFACERLLHGDGHLLSLEISLPWEGQCLLGDQQGPQDTKTS